jgi:hypothetical protein
MSWKSSPIVGADAEIGDQKKRAGLGGKCTPGSAFLRYPGSTCEETGLSLNEM